MRVHRYIRKTCSVLPVLLAFLCSNAVADVTGSILGVVRDRTNAVVVGARVVATNAQTNFSKAANSGPDGTYRILALPAGPYKVVAEASGFERFTATDIDVKVNDQLRIDITLDVGSVQNQVSVEASAVQVQTESTQLGDVIESKKMLALPLNGRSYIDLLGLQAGVAPTTSGTIGGDRPVSGMLDAGNVSVNGQRETANAFLVNGGDVSEGRNMGAGLIPNLDSIEEFRLITNSFDAEYGKFSGAVMNAITKSGTNGFHGDAFEFLRNDNLDARNFFDPTKAELRQNQFGYAVGGPIWKNKIFWFTDYQGTRQVSGASTGLVSVPTDAQRAGDFGANAFTGSVQGAYWAQVLSQRLGYPVQNGEPYNSVFPNGVIPKSAWSAPSIGILPYIPAPNQPGGFADASHKGSINDDKIGQRVDFNNEKTGNWSFYYHNDWSSVYNPLAAASVPGFPAITPASVHLGTLSNVKTFGPTMVNELRMSKAIAELLAKLANKGLSVEHYSAQDKPLFEVIEGTGEKEQVKPLFSIPEILGSVKEVGRRGLSIKRFKGLGEMNPKELFETTMNPVRRKLLRVDLTDAIEAEEMFAKLMGEEVEPRRQFIEDNALNVRNLDI